MFYLVQYFGRLFLSSSAGVLQIITLETSSLKEFLVCGIDAQARSVPVRIAFVVYLSLTTINSWTLNILCTSTQMIMKLTRTI